MMKELGAVEGMSADLKVEDGRLVIVPVDETPRFELSELIAGITKENIHGEISAGHATGNEFA